MITFCTARTTLLAAVLLLSAGCSREQQDWRSAEGADTSEAFAHFLEQHPDERARQPGAAAHRAAGAKRATGTAPTASPPSRRTGSFWRSIPMANGPRKRASASRGFRSARPRARPRHRPMSGRSAPASTRCSSPRAWRIRRRPRRPQPRKPCSAQMVAGTQAVPVAPSPQEPPPARRFSQGLRRAARSLWQPGGRGSGVAAAAGSLRVAAGRPRPAHRRRQCWRWRAALSAAGAGERRGAGAGLVRCAEGTVAGLRARHPALTSQRKRAVGFHRRPKAF